MSLAWLQLAGAVVFNVGSYVIYKAIVDAAPRVWWPMFALGLALGAANTWLFAHSLRGIPLSIAFPVFSGASFVTITVASTLAFGEPLRGLTLLGLALVLAGSALVLYSK